MQGKIVTFADLKVWQEAHTLTLLLYTFTSRFPKDEIYALTSQLCRAVVSVESCIAEGFSRYHYKDRLTFYYDARGSIGEIQSQIITARDLKYIVNEEYEKVFKQSEKVAILLGGLIKSTNERVKK